MNLEQTLITTIEYLDATLSRIDRLQCVECTLHCETCEWIIALRIMDDSVFALARQLKKVQA